MFDAARSEVAALYVDLGSAYRGGDVMAKLKRGKSSKKLVLDLGSSAVRLCELTPTKTGYQLTKYYHREFPIDPSMEEDAQREARKAAAKSRGRS